MGVKTASELAEIIVSVGLAQNMAALRALAAEGIQRGHMSLHAAGRDRGRGRRRNDRKGRGGWWRKKLYGLIRPRSIEGSIQVHGETCKTRPICLYACLPVYLPMTQRKASHSEAISALVDGLNPIDWAQMELLAKMPPERFLPQPARQRHHTRRFELHLKESFRTFLCQKSYENSGLSDFHG